MSSSSPKTVSTLIAERRGHLGIVTLNRPGALNALSLEMIRQLTGQLLAWRDDPDIGAVVLRGAARPGKAPAFCAGGDIRFFHQGALAGDPRVEDFFTEEYTLDYLVHTFPKPTLALMDGITMGGGMGLSQGTRLRIVTEHSKLAMPETNIGLFPDVGGGGFLARNPGHLGEFLGLTGQVVQAADAIEIGWADIEVASSRLDELLDAVAAATRPDGQGALESARAFAQPIRVGAILAERPLIDRVFGLPSLREIVAALQSETGAFAAEAARLLSLRSPLMMAVTLEQIRRARGMTLAEDLRMERDLMRHCFHLRPGASETLEGIRALAVDKDHSPRWNPPTVAEIDDTLVQAFFTSPWPAFAHPLRHLD